MTYLICLWSIARLSISLWLPICCTCCRRWRSCLLTGIWAGWVWILRCHTLLQNIQADWKKHILRYMIYSHFSKCEVNNKCLLHMIDSWSILSVVALITTTWPSNRIFTESSNSLAFTFPKLWWLHLLLRDAIHAYELNLRSYEVYSTYKFEAVLPYHLSFSFRVQKSLDIINPLLRTNLYSIMSY